MAKTIVTGEYQPHLEMGLAQAVRRTKDNDPLAPLLIVVPTNLLALHLSRLLARKLGGHAELHFLTLIDLARRLGERPLALKGLSSLPPMGDQLLLRETVREFLSTRSGSYFSRVAESEGFIGVFLGAVADLKEGCLQPGDLIASADAAKLRRVAGDKIREVAALWNDYEDRKTCAGFYDRADLMAEAASNTGANRWFSGLRKLFFYGFYDLNPLQRRLVERCASGKDTTVFFPYLDEPAFEYARPTLGWLRSLGFRRFRAGSKTEEPERPPAGESEIAPLAQQEPTQPSGAAGGPLGDAETATPREVKAQRHGDAQTIPQGLAQATPSGLANLRAWLFRRSLQGVAQPDGVSILSAPGEARESREICRELLRLVGLNATAESGRDDASNGREGSTRPSSAGALRFNEVGILLRQPTAYIAHFAQVLDGIGVEPFITEGLPLGRLRAGRSLILLMELIESDLARRQVMDFLTFAEVDFEAFLGRRSVEAEPRRGERGREDPSGARRDQAPLLDEASTSLWDLLSKEAGVVKGLDSWRAKLSALQRRMRFRDDSEIRENGEEPKVDLVRRRALVALIDFIEALALRLKSFPEVDRPTKFVKETVALYAALMPEAPQRGTVIQALEELALLDLCGPSIDRASFFWLVRRHLESIQTPLGSFQGEGPTVTGLMAARGLPFKVVVLPGLTEGWFPQAARQDPVLLDGERRALNNAFAKAGVEGELGFEAERIREERLLFRLAIGAASRVVLLTYPRIDPLTGGERIPSSFLLEAAGAVTGARCDASSLDALSVTSRIGVARLFPEDEAFLGRNELDLSVAEIAVARGDPDALVYLEEKDTFFASAVEAERQRWGEARFTPYDGALENPESISALRGKYAGASGAAAPTSLEDYAGCPFVYLMRHILGIEALDEPEEMLSVSPRDRGGLAHKILDRTYREIFPEGEEPKRDWERILRRNAEQVLDSFSERTAFGLPLLWDLEEDRLVADLVSSVGRDLEALEGFAPWRLELAYGLGDRAGLGAPLQLPLGEGRQIALGGKMDRVDMDRGAARARVIDYKTGKGKGLKDNSLSGGRSLQLPLYVLGARHILGREIEVTGAEYFFVSGAKRGSRVHFAAREVDNRMEDVVTVLKTVVGGVEAGLFFAHPGDSCRYCEYAMACGQCRFLFERKRTDPRVAGFLRMQEIE